MSSRTQTSHQRRPPQKAKHSVPAAGVGVPTTKLQILQLEDFATLSDDGEPDGTMRDLDSLEAKIFAGQRQAIESLVEIRDRRLWKLIQEEAGTQTYETFDAYLDDRHYNGGKKLDASTVSKMKNWLVVNDAATELGITQRIKPWAAQSLVPSRVNEIGGVRVILAECMHNQEKYTANNLDRIVARRTEFETGEYAADTYEQYRKDLDTVAVLNGMERNDSSAQSESDEDLIAKAITLHAVPSGDVLLRRCTGDQLKELVTKLAKIRQLTRAIAKHERRQSLLTAELTGKATSTIEASQPADEPSHEEAVDLLAALVAAQEWLEGATSQDWPEEGQEAIEAALAGILAAVETIQSRKPADEPVSVKPR